MEKRTVRSTAFTAALEDGSVTFAGKDEDTDYKALVKSQCGISILPSDILPTEEADTEAKAKPSERFRREIFYSENPVYCRPFCR